MHNKSEYAIQSFAMYCASQDRYAQYSEKMRIIFTTILVLISLLIFSQNPYQINDTTKLWNTVLIGHGSSNIHYCGGTKSNRMEGEYVIDGHIYLGVLQSTDSLQTNWDVYGFLREDSVNKKVFFYDGWDNEGLIYDFTIDVSDTVNIDNLYTTFNSQLICEEIDSVLINGSIKKRFLFSSPYSYYPAEIWIEGIGSMFGLLNSGLGGAAVAGGTTQLLCCSKNDTIIYMDSVFGQCYMDVFYPQFVSENYDTAYLNSNYEFQLQINNLNDNSYSFNGIVIPENFELDEITGLITGTPNTVGSYYCAISVQNDDFGFSTDILSSYINVVLPLKIQTELIKSNINIYPNPFSTYIYISVNKIKNDSYYLEIYNSEGEVIETKTISKNDSKLDFSMYNNGLYIFKIKDLLGNTIKTQKIIKK